MLQQAAALPHNLAAWPLLALMALTVYAAFPPALAGAIEEDFGFMSVGKWFELVGRLKSSSQFLCGGGAGVGAAGLAGSWGQTEEATPCLSAALPT